jgi:MATE family multidrug resistance protein
MRTRKAISFFTTHASFGVPPRTVLIQPGVARPFQVNDKLAKKKLAGNYLKNPTVSRATHTSPSKELTTFQAAREISKVSTGVVPLQMIKGLLPFLNSMILARLSSPVRACAPLINTMIDVNYLLFSSPTYCISAAAGLLNTDADKKNIGEVVHAGWILSAICTVPQLAIMYFNVPILTLMGQDPELITLTDTFLKIYIYAVPVANFQTVSEQAVLATKHLTLPLSAQFISLILWGGVSYSLTFGAPGIPAMGLEGAAYAYLARVYFNSIAFHSALYYLSGEKRTFSEHNIFKFQPNALQRLKSLSSNALSIFGLFLLETGEIFLPTFFAGMISQDALSAQLLISQYQELILFIVSGKAISSQILLANNVGNKQFENIVKLGDTGLKLALLLPILYTGLMLVSPDLLLQTFIDPANPANQNIIDLLLAQKVLFISGLNIGMISLRLASAEALIGIGKASPAMMKNMSLSWLGIGLSYYLGVTQEMGLLGINLGLMAGLILSSAGQLRLWHKTSRAFRAENVEAKPVESVAKLLTQFSSITAKPKPDKMPTLQIEHMPAKEEKSNSLKKRR